MKSSWLLFISACVFVFFCGCTGDTGPAGPAGEDGEDGIDGNVTCMECHNTETQDAISLQYQRSQHAIGEFVDYAGGRSYCANCHSGTGFTEYQDTGTVDGNINNPVPFDCEHCHSVHTTFEEADYALRGTDPVPFIWDEDYSGSVVDFGDNSNVCANCHQSRRAEPLMVSPGEEFEITSTHYGPHHGAQSNVLKGVGFAEIEGSRSYPTTTNKHLDGGATCVTCHMGSYADGEGGHTWNPSLAACNTCHATESFDYGDVQTEMEELLVELRDLLIAAEVIEWVEEDEAYEPIVGTHDMVAVRAFFNWIGLEEDRSMGVHNPPYVKALLVNSIEALEAIAPAP